MNKYVFKSILILQTIYFMIIVVELSSCLSVLSFKHFRIRHLEKYLDICGLETEFNTLIQYQIIRCLALLFRPILSVLLFVFINTIDRYFISKRSDTRIQITFGETEMFLNDQNNTPHNFVTVDKTYWGRFNTYFEPLMMNILHYLENENNILLFISYFSLFVTYLNFLSHFKLIPILLIVPYTYKKINIKLYQKYRIIKPIVYNIYLAVFKCGLICGMSFFKGMGFAKNYILPQEFLIYLKEKSLNPIVLHKNSSIVKLRVFKIFNHVVLYLTGSFEPFNTQEQTTYLYKEVARNSFLIENIFFVLLTSLVEIIIEILSLKNLNGYFVQEFTKIGEFFICFIIIQMNVVPLINACLNLYNLHLEVKTDAYGKEMTDIVNMGMLICKQTFYNKETISLTLPFNLVFD